MTLPQWQKEIIDAGELYLVGGIVRDQLMGSIESAPDIDYLVRGIPPEDLEALLERHGSVNLVGRVFGVYKFTPTGATTPFDIAYPRREISIGAGHTEFRIESDWRLPVEEDLGRRDFSINAMARRVDDGTLIDPYGGAADVKAKTIRMLFPEAFMEDPLRILRGVRFATRFDFTIDKGTWEAMRRSAEMIAYLSAERVQEEMTKLLTQCDYPSRGFESMRFMGVLNNIMPELEAGAGVSQNEYHPDDVYLHGLKSCDAAPKDNPAVRWAALLHDTGKTWRKQAVTDEKTGEKRIVFYQHEEKSAEIARDVLGRLRYSNNFVSKVVGLVANHMFNYSDEWKGGAVRRFMRKVGEEHLDDLFELRRADCRSRNLTEELTELERFGARIQKEIAAQNAFTVEKLAVNGNDVMRELQLESGEAVGRILNQLLEQVLDNPALNERETLLGIIKEENKK